MNIRSRLNSGHLDAPRTARTPVDAPPPPTRSAPRTAPLTQEPASASSKLSLGNLKEKAPEKAKALAEELERGDGWGEGAAEPAEVGAASQEPASGVLSTFEQGITQGAANRRMANFAIDVVRAVPVMDKLGDAAEGAVDRLAQAQGHIGNVGRALKTGQTVGDVVEKADLGLLATGSVKDARDQVTDIVQAVRAGDTDEALAQTRDLARGSLDVAEGGKLGADVTRATSARIQSAVAQSRPLSGMAARVQPAVAAGARTVTRAVKAVATVASPVLRAVTGVAGKAAGRFIPGVNAAIAVTDSYRAVETFRNPKASGWNKFTAGVTAAGSIAAATNIPGVSQVGATISILGSLAPKNRPRWLGGK
ncbi:MAG: hypothetical protein VKP72_04390 [bacterium]|nr:hypothetical protein [bacterium]